MEKIKDNVNHPEHYISGRFECIEVIEEGLGIDIALGFCRGNALKYIYRAGKKHKEKEIEDLEKAVWYLNREISLRKKLLEENKDE